MREIDRDYINNKENPQRFERLGLIDRDSTHISLKNGTKISIHKIDEYQNRTLDETSEHEALHIVGAQVEGVKINKATVIPSGTALGSVTPARLTPIATLAPAAYKKRGTWYDEILASQVLGVDPEATMRAARSALSGKGELVHEVASILHERGTIYQADVDEANENVRNREQGNFKINVYVDGLDGSYYFSAETNHDSVEIPDVGRQTYEVSRYNVDSEQDKLHKHNSLQQNGPEKIDDYDFEAVQDKVLSSDKSVIESDPVERERKERLKVLSERLAEEIETKTLKTFGVSIIADVGGGYVHIKKKGEAFVIEETGEELVEVELANNTDETNMSDSVRVEA